MEKNTPIEQEGSLQGAYREHFRISLISFVVVIQLGTNYLIFTWTPELTEKFQNAIFFGDFLNSFNWATQIGPKTTQKFFFENISKTMGATVIQNFGILDGAADLRVEI